MLTETQNRTLTEVGPETPMGDYLRRYWHPIAGESELDDQPIKPIRILGEDLVLYRDLQGTFGLVERHCAHRRADLSYGMVDEQGIRCHYHGWCYNQTGACVARPFDDIAFPEQNLRERIRINAYPVDVKGGMVWAYMGPQPVPQLPDWEAFSWPNGFTQVVISEIPCNWFQCQENSIDPVHFEWMHENWDKQLRGDDSGFGSRHLKLDFVEFDHGFTYRRIKDDTDEEDENWTVGRVFLWPNGFFLGDHFEWRVPIDDSNTLSITWKYTRVPRDRDPYVQEQIPTWHGPLYDSEGKWITSHVMNQDFLAWVGQGVIADRTKENLGASDRGVLAIRRRFFEELDKVAAGGEPKGTIREPQLNTRVELPMMNRDGVLSGLTRDEITKGPPLHRLVLTSYIFQAGQPDEVKRQFREATGFDSIDYEGLK
ncbi:MAG: aromatic ring-hydroxylating dioxygenase subunit alpha [Gammaproteobacteria bacterium]|nr:aromatic ring-hydroxylating dioxygenase subunit alpha [Gammaproteobacteria bacterium]